MSLKIYEKPDSATAFSVSGLYTNPLAVTVDGATGQTLEKRYYIRNDNSSFTYSGISVSSVDNSGKHLTDGTIGFSWKLSGGDARPLEAEWDTLAAGNSTVISGISNITTFLPFWLRIEIPRAVRVQSFDTVVLRLTATETIV